MLGIIVKVEALASSLGRDIDTLWEEFVAFLEHKKAVTPPAPEPTPTDIKAG